MKAHFPNPRRHAAFIPYMLMLPTILLLCWLLVYPVFNVFYTSFRQEMLSRPKANAFIGLKNYHKILSDPVFLEALGNSLRWVITEAMAVASRQEVKTGPAWIRSGISGEMKDYAIEIQKIDINSVVKFVSDRKKLGVPLNKLYIHHNSLESMGPEETAVLQKQNYEHSFINVTSPASLTPMEESIWRQLRGGC